MKKYCYFPWLILVLSSAAFSTFAQKQTLSANVRIPATSVSRSSSSTSSAVGREEADIRIDGEKRFETNCGRCHMSPEKFPPRMMATIIRHMRVRATITDEDMRAILLYMTH